MKYLPLVFAGLWRKPLRTTLTFLTIVVAFILFGVMAGVDSGISHILSKARLDRLVVSGRFGGTMPMAYAAEIAAMPGVSVVAPQLRLFGYHGDPKDSGIIVMADKRLFAVAPELTATQQQIAELENDRRGLIITVAAARKNNLKVGDRYPWISSAVGGNGSRAWDFHVIAIVDDTNFPGVSQFFIGNYLALDDGMANQPSRFAVRIKDADQAARISHAIDLRYANSPAPTRSQSEKSITESGLGQLGDISYLTRMVIGAVLFMLLCLTGNTMTQSVRERIPEFAVLKTLGFSDSGVLALVIAESALLCLAAGLTGLLIMHLAAPAVALKLDIANIFLVTWPSFFTGLGFALLTALAAAMLPAWRARQLNVVDALVRR